jgi:hypothetical protein
MPKKATSLSEADFVRWFMPHMTNRNTRYKQYEPEDPEVQRALTEKRLWTRTTQPDMLVQGRCLVNRMYYIVCDWPYQTHFDITMQWESDLEDRRSKFDHWMEGQHVRVLITEEGEVEVYVDKTKVLHVADGSGEQVQSVSLRVEHPEANSEQSLDPDELVVTLNGDEPGE